MEHKNTLMAVAAIAIMSSCADNTTKLSLELAHSEMVRHENPMTLDFQKAPKWDYSAATELCGMWDVATLYSDEALRTYATQWVDTMVLADGTIRGYKKTKYNIDHVCPGKLLLRLYAQTGDQRLLTACDTLFAQMQTHPRTAEGGFWHKKVYPHQMWLDGLYMGAPFLAEYAKVRGIDTLSADVARQFMVVGSHTYDSDTKLYRHAWDESHTMFWCDSVTGRSRHAWGRANGWYMMGMVDALEFIPENTAGRDSVVSIFANLAQTLLDYSDPESGMWYQVLDSPKREGNFIESSCSAMFIYSFLKGARIGVLPAEFKQIGEEKFAQFVQAFVAQDEENGLYSLTRCCAVAGLGGKDMRDGTFDYYIHEQIRDNDPKTIGPFLMACAELGR